MEVHNVERRLAAILAADVVGYSRLMEVDEAGTLARLKTIRLEVIDPAIGKCRGRIIKTAGDGMLIEFQSVQMTVADMVLQVEAARLLIYRAARTAGTGLPDPLEVSLAKCTANEMAKRVSDLAMQLHGGNGYTEEYGIERLHRDAHGWAVAGGTPAMQRIRIVSELLGRRFDQRS